MKQLVWVRSVDQAKSNVLIIEANKNSFGTDILLRFVNIIYNIIKK